MKPRVYISKTGACAMLEKNETSGMFSLIVRSAAGQLIDKVRCDSWPDARDYWRAFKALADNKANA